MEKHVQGIRLNDADNVVTVLQAAEPGTVVFWDEDQAERVTAGDPIPRFHKIAIEDIDKGGVIRKYGSLIGVATAPIRRGEHVHTHNCAGTAVEVLIS